MKKSMLIVFVIAIAMIACKKESVLSEPPVILRESQMSSKNPYDIVGQIHNRAMDFISADHDLLVDDSINLEKINYKVADYLKTRESCVMPPIFFSPAIQKQYKAIVKSDDLPQLLADYGWSATGVEYVKELFVILETSKTQKESNDNIIILENRILEEKFMQKKEHDILLATMSVSRYSIEWWTNKYNGPLSKPNGWKADAAGAIAGGIAGAIIGGTVTVGLATVPGWLAGAFGGGISSSISACFDYYM